MHCLKHPSLTHNHAIIFWDISIGVGNLLDAILQRASSWDFQWMYFDVCDNVEHHHWLEYTKKNKLIADFLCNTIEIPGQKPLPKIAPAELQLKPPDPPALQILSVQSVIDTSRSDVDQASQGVCRKRLTASVPEDLIKTWAHHPVHGPAFQANLQEFKEIVDDLAVILNAEDQSAITLNKRKRPDGARNCNTS